MVFTLFPQLRFTLLDRGHEHVADAGSGQAVEATLHAIDGDDVQVLSTWRAQSRNKITQKTLPTTSFERKNQVVPVLSAQFMTAPTGRPSEMRNFPPADPPRPESENATSVTKNVRTSHQTTARRTSTAAKVFRRADGGG